MIYLLQKMSSSVDPRRPDKIRPYKPSTNNNGATSGGEDFLPDYMNILGMIFSMCGLMMKLKWCGKCRLTAINQKFICIERTCIKLLLFDHVAWLALYCSCISFANSRASDDAKQVSKICHELHCNENKFAMIEINCLCIFSF